MQTPKQQQQQQQEEEKLEQQQNLSSQFLNDFFQLLFDPNSTTEADRMRWFEQPIHTKYNSWNPDNLLQI